MDDSERISLLSEIRLLKKIRDGFQMMSSNEYRIHCYWQLRASWPLIGAYLALALADIAAS
jgi:hypothetical protein